MKVDYVIWTLKKVKYMCSLRELKSVDKQYEFMEGISRKKGFPKDASFDMNPDTPNDTVLTDSLPNISSMIVVSEAFKNLLEQNKVEQVEYLSVNIRDHKKKLIGPKYYIVHTLNHLDCLDSEKSGAVWSLVDEESIDRVKKLVLLPRKIDETRKLFRIAHFPDVVLVRRDLAKAISDAGLTGVQWMEIADYPFVKDDEEEE